MTRKNGCFDYDIPKLGDSMVVQDGYYPDSEGFSEGTRIPRYITIPYQMSEGCKYSEHGYASADQGCTGCKNNVK